MPGDPLSWLFLVVALGWLIFTAGRLRDLSFVPSLPSADALTPPGPAPRVTVIVAARNEGARIEGTVRQLLAQQGVELQLVVVDDRSSDATPEILGRLAAGEPRLEVVRVEQLAEGWLGKPHACDLGARRARGDWLLFTDADAWIGSDVLARTVRTAEREDCEHLCLLPGESRTTLAARAALLDFSLGMLFFASRANRDRPGSFIGVGAFNLVRAEAYREIGGHAAQPLEVLDDLVLGLRLRRAGFRSRAYGAARDVEVEWAATAPGLIRALEKNSFALLGFRFPLAIAAVLVPTLVLIASVLGAWSGRPAGFAATFGMFSIILPCLALARRSGWGVLPALLAPLFLPFLIAALAGSTFSAWRRGGVVWRGTFYSLEFLRKRP